MGLSYFDLQDQLSDYNVHQFIVSQILATVRGSTLVQVLAVKDVNGNPVAQTGNIAPVGLVDAQPMVNAVDGAGNFVSNGPVIHNVPYSRVQGGGNAIICDPQIGDIGVAVFADQDISAVKNTKAFANPGSFRRNDWADGIYLFGVLNGTPTQWLAYTPTGLNLTDINGNTIVTGPSGILINGVLFQLNGPTSVYNTHEHPQGVDSHGDTEQDTGAPIPGS